MSEFFGYLPNEDGDINFMQVETDFLINSWEHYEIFRDYFYKLMDQNPDIMPVLVFRDETGS